MAYNDFELLPLGAFRLVGRKIRLFKKDSEAPDLTEMTNVSREAVAYAKEIGNRQQDLAERQYDELAPVLKGISNSQVASQDELTRQGRDYYDYQVNTFRPLEKQIVADAENFNTDAYRERQALTAAADVGSAFKTTQEANARSMAAMGVNPNSGKFQASTDRNNLNLAAIRAGAMTGARDKAEQMGYARKLDAAGLGRNLSGASTSAYSAAISAGNSAGTNAGTAGNQLISNLGTAGATANNGYSTGLNGLSNVANTQAKLYDSDSIDVGGVLSGVGSIMKVWPSDRRLKENVALVGVDERTGLNLYEFNYTNELGGKRYRGVMADEVESKFPDAVEYDSFGFAGVNYDALGIEMVEV